MPGWSPRLPVPRDTSSVAMPTQAGLWPALLPGQAWRLSARDAHRVTLGSGGSVASRGVHCRARPQTQTAIQSPVAPEQERLLQYSRQHDASSSNPEDPPHMRGGSSGFRMRSAWIGSTDRRRGRGASAARPLPVALSDERIVPLMRKAERDVLPGDDPNTPWRRLAYQLRLAPSLSDLLAIYRANRESPVWRPHMTALVLNRIGALLYPKAVAAAASTAQGDGRTDGVGRFPPPQLKRDAVSLFESLSGRVTKRAVRQVQGMHLARVLVAMAWLEVAGEECEMVVAALVGELQRQRGGKLVQVAMVDPALFGRLVRALAQLVPRERELWVDLQRVTLAALMEAQAEAQAQAPVAAGSSRSAVAVPAPKRVWSGPSRDAVKAEAAASPLPPPEKPDCSTADLANMAFGFAAAGAASPQLFAALRSAVLSRELPDDPDTLARLMCAWGRAHIPAGPLLYRVLDAFVPLVATASPRPIGRMIWSLAMMRMRDERFLRAAAKAIVDRRLVFSSPQELVNVVWAYSHLGWQVEEGAEPRRPWSGTATAEELAAEGREGSTRGKPRGMLRQPPARLKEDVEEAAEEGVDGTWSAGQRREQKDAEQRSVDAARLEGGTAASTSAAARYNADEPEGRSEALERYPGIRAGDEAAASVEGSAAPKVPGAPAGMPVLKPLPLTAPLAAREQARQAMLFQQPPEYPEHFALYRYLGHSFIHRKIGSNAHHAISNSQLAVLVGSFARAGYRSKQLFYTAARIALLRLQFLSPADLTLLLSAHARLRIAHSGLFEAACPIVAARCCEFTPAQLADVLWAVQVLMPEGFVQLSNAVRTRRGWLPPPVPPAASALGMQPGQLDGLGEEAEEDGEERVEETRGRRGVMTGAGGRGEREDGPMLPALMRLRVPRELLEDVDWIEAEDGGEEVEEGSSAAEFRDRDDSPADSF
ncbi:hypothetical protein VOLCADRAFT_92312 [Volvox carteri f. nagariensis]|uniref:Uncharacterized protein n=1 Tax=Volvox carteri f. nagariensis TaxID=3068 RepID=D8TZC0_VOLCA|nr:uncharacterized protein VOLCADRAFT_92312 [Volvox carteri f. nagariensis]EFJ47247.1 hypothetical protein VOLCADRAFT_92312 [Volvox carteri f. nagariensis]|eukprot:XP_002951796.1 hypothetical protein VOLCADRAFT_92312 [Volvox carteri f. nagariensis]